MTNSFVFLRRALSQFDDEEVAWITYEEYTFIKEAIDAEVKYGDIDLVIIRNNNFLFLTHC